MNFTYTLEKGQAGHKGNDGSLGVTTFIQSRCEWQHKQRFFVMRSAD